MRLIDADPMRQDWLDNGQNEYIYDTNAFLDSIDNQPTIDPIHATGSCYCQECRYFSPRVSINFCARTGVTCEPRDFCSYGERKDGAKQKEAGTDVHQQDD